MSGTTWRKPSSQPSGATALLAAHRARESDDRTVLSAAARTVLHAVRDR